MSKHNRLVPLIFLSGYALIPILAIYWVVLTPPARSPRPDGPTNSGAAASPTVSPRPLPMPPDRSGTATSHGDRPAKEAPSLEEKLNSLLVAVDEEFKKEIESHEELKQARKWIVAASRSKVGILTAMEFYPSGVHPFAMRRSVDDNEDEYKKRKHYIMEDCE